MGRVCRKTERPAQITVFVSMVLVVILTLLCTSLESARVSVLRYYIKTAAESSMFSLFSEYHKTLFDRYHLFFLEDNGNLEQKITEYVAYYQNPSKDLMVSGMHLYPFQTESVRLTGRISALDQNGMAFEEEIMEYMKYGMVEVLVDQVRELLDAGGQCQKITGAIHQIAAMSDEIFALEESYLALKTNGQELKTVAEHAVSELDRVRTLMREKQEAEAELGARQAAVNGLEGPALAAAEVELISVRIRVSSIQNHLDAAVDQAEHSETALQRAAAQSGICLERIAERTEQFQERTEPVLSELEQMKSQLSEPLLDVVRQQTEAVEVYTEDNGERKALAEAFGQSINCLEDSMKELPGIREAVENGVEGLLEQKVSLIRDNTEMAWPETLQTVKEPDENGFMKAVKQFMDQGVLALVLGPDVKLSERIADGNDMPSVEMRQTEKENHDNTNDGTIQTLLEGLYQNVCLNEYVIKTMPSFGSDLKDTEKTGFYDLEYVLGNSSADQKNLATVMERLLLLREGMNLIYLFGDQRKAEEAQLLALTLTGAVGLTPLAGLVRIMILVAWAFAESVADVRTLAGGGKVPFFKKASDWRTSLEHVPEQIGKPGIQAVPDQGIDPGLQTEKESDKKKERGMGYQDYIRLLLCFISKEKKLYRCMDMVQWNIKQEDPEFRLKNCLYQVSIQAEFQADQMFVTLPFMRSGVASGGTYAFMTVETRGYGETFGQYEQEEEILNETNQ